MELDDAAASGQVSDNAGHQEAMNIDDAITAALGASEVKADSPSPDKKPEADKSAGDEPAGEKPVGEDVKAAEQDKQASPTEAPKHWPENRRQTFAKMPPEVQAEWLAHDKDLQGGFTRKSQELSDKARLADAVRDQFSEAERAQMQQSGINEVAAIKHLVELNRFATRDGPGYVKWVMDKLGVTPDHLGIPQTKQPDPVKEDVDPLAALLNPQPDPRVKQLEEQLAALRGDVTGMKTAGERAIQAQQTRQQQALEGAIQSFRSSIDDHGLPQYPHFDQVQKHMGVLMDADPDLVTMPDGPEKLKLAYDMAVHARPDLRQSVIEQEVSKRVAAEKKKEEAERAKRITAIKGGTNAPTAKAAPNSLDDIIKNSMAQHGHTF